MIKRLLSLLLVAVLAHTAPAAQAPAKTQADKDARHAEKVRAGVQKLGTGPKARVRVELRDKTRLGGYVSEAGADSFTVKDEKTGAATNVEYGQVSKLLGRDMSTGKKIAIGVGIAAGVMVVALVAVFASMSAGRIGEF